MVYMLYRWNRLVSSRRRFSCCCRFLGNSRTFCGLWQSSLNRQRKRILLYSRVVSPMFGSRRQDGNLSVSAVSLIRHFQSERMHTMSAIHPLYYLIHPHGRRSHSRMSAVFLAFEGELIARIIASWSHNLTQKFVVPLILTPVWRTDPYRRNITNLAQDGTDAFFTSLHISRIQFVAAQTYKDMGRFDTLDIMLQGIGSSPVSGT